MPSRVEPLRAASDKSSPPDSDGRARTGGTVSRVETSRHPKFREGDPVLAMDVDLDFRGLPRENVSETLKTWTGLMTSFRRFIHGG